MIFICNSANHVTPFFTGSLRQGEINANEILFLAPYPLAGTTVSLRVILPNGIVLPADPKTAFVFAPVELGADMPLNLGDVALNAWRLRVDAAITEFSGNVTFQFAIARVGGEGIPPALFTTDTVVENIPRGVPALIPSNADYEPSLIELYNQAVTSILEASAAENTAKDYKWAAEEARDQAVTAKNQAEAAAATAANNAANAAQNIINQAVQDAQTAAGQAQAAATHVDSVVGDLQLAFDKLHTYAQNIINGGEEE